MQRPGELERMSRPVQEVGIAERDVACTCRDEAPDVFEHDLARDGEEPATVDRRNGAVQAVMQAAAARFDVARRHVRARSREMDVAVEIREPDATRNGIREPVQRRHPAGGTRPVPLYLLHQRDEGALELSADDRVRDSGSQVVGVEQRVQSVEADEALGIELPDAVRRPHAQPERGVHRYRNPCEPGAPDFEFIEWIDREVEVVGSVSRALEERAGPCDPERLVAQLVAGDEQYRARSAQVTRHGIRHGGTRQFAHRARNATTGRGSAVCQTTGSRVRAGSVRRTGARKRQ